MSIATSCAAAPPAPLSGGGGAGAPPIQQSPMQVPTQGGGAIAGAQGAPAQSPMQVPMQSTAVQGAAGGGQAVQAPPVQAPPVQAPPVEQAPAAPPVSGGGAGDLSAVLPALQQVVTALTSVVSALQAQLAAGQAQAGVAGVQGGGGEAQAAGCGCGCSMAAGAAVPVQQSGAAGAPEAPAAPAPASAPKPPSGGGAGAGKLDDPNLTVKGKKMDAKQRANLEAVLQVGKEMGANEKVLKAAIATVIQESVARNDSSVDSKDHDSLGLFQQRPSMGWGTREQISDPRYAARKFFEKAIPNDKKKPDQPMTLLAQSVQISAFPHAYAKWEDEAAKIVADFMG